MAVYCEEVGADISSGQEQVPARGRFVRVAEGAAGASRGEEGMSLGSLVGDTLDVWRDAERVLKMLPPNEPAHEAVRMLVIELRDMYARVSVARDSSGADVARDKARVVEARKQLRELSNS